MLGGTLYRGDWGSGAEGLAGEAAEQGAALVWSLESQLGHAPALHPSLRHPATIYKPVSVIQRPPGKGLENWLFTTLFSDGKLRLGKKLSWMHLWDLRKGASADQNP